MPDASQIQYQYEHQTLAITNGAVVAQEPYSTHLILKEIKPDGRTLKNEYDAHRRVINQCATVGLDLNLVRNATFTYVNDFDLDEFLTERVAGYTTISEVFSKVTRYDDTNSQITKVTDPLDQTVEQEWYAENATAPGHPRSLWKSKYKRVTTHCIISLTLTGTNPTPPLSSGALKTHYQSGGRRKKIAR